MTAGDGMLTLLCLNALVIATTHAYLREDQGVENGLQPSTYDICRESTICIAQAVVGVHQYELVATG